MHINIYGVGDRVRVGDVVGDVMDISLLRTTVMETGEWVKVEKKFTIPDGIDYIRFRLFGAGIREYRFDDINFRKEG